MMAVLFLPENILRKSFLAHNLTTSPRASHARDERSCTLRPIPSDP